jgi:glucan biosynthesis protein C
VPAACRTEDGSAHRETHLRYDFLDWLRVIAIFVLLFFHTGMLFVGWGWHITNAEVIPSLELPMDLAHRLRMPLLFLIAGAGMWFALKRRSGAALVGERSLRLLLPAAIGMLLVVPPQVYVERLVAGDWSGTYLDFMLHRVLEFRPYPEGDFSWHHLWFIVYLYVYVMLLLPLMLWWWRAQPELRPGWWFFLLGLPLAVNEALLKPLYPETHALIDDWYTFNHYLLLTLYGFALASLREGWDWLAAQRRVSLGVAITVTVLGVGALELGIAPRDTPWDAFIANVFTWSWILVFLGYGRQHLSFSNRLLAWAREASYPVYIFHQTVIIVIAYFVIREPWTPWVKYWVVLGTTLAVSVGLYELTHRFAVTRVMFGMKSPPQTTPIPIVGSSRTSA